MNRYSTPLILFAIAFIFQGCLKDRCISKYHYVEYTPVYMSYEDMRDAVALESPRPVENPGKIYFKDNYILLNEVDKGIHIIDNSDPSNPHNIGFINIPGNIDMAMYGSILYADSYVDLLAIDIMDPTNIKVTDRQEDVFPYRSYNGFQVDPDEGVVVDWIQKDVTDETDCNQYYWNNPGVFFDNGANIVVDAGIRTSSFSNGGFSTSLNPGIGGSMARFAVLGYYLYAVDANDLNVFELSEQTHPQKVNEVNIGWGIETIYPYDDKLFIGSQTGMFIYDCSAPVSPSQISSFAHVSSCDPVAVEGDYAYVTLRGGTPCRGYTNQLDVIDISNISSPQLVKSYDMEGPYGLGVDNGTLFICDGHAGLKIYDASDPMKIDQNEIAHFDQMAGYDVIPLGNVLLFTGPDGLRQYDYSDLENLKLLSTIPVLK